MDFFVSGLTDVGKRASNQDNYSARVISINGAQFALLVLCDGMGGFEKGELASSSVVGIFEKWLEESFPVIYKQGLSDDIIRNEWISLINRANAGILQFSESNNIRMGTTLTAVLLTSKRYYAVNVGDSRIYEIGYSVKQISKDHSLVAREVELGKITEEEALVDKRRNVLLQCIGGAATVSPDFYFGTPNNGTKILLCSDGFWHDVKKEELVTNIGVLNVINKEILETALNGLLSLIKGRGETDNISALIGVCIGDDARTVEL